MIYSEAERKEIERVYGVFKDYIHASKFLDFVWSEKLGYLLLHIDPTKNTIEEDQIIASADELCAELFNEVATDVFQEAKREHFYPDAKSRFLLFIAPAPDKRGRFLLYVEVNKLNTGIRDALVKKHSASCTFYNNSVENIAPCTGPPLRTEIRCKYSYITFQARQPNWLSGLFRACLFEYAR